MLHDVFSGDDGGTGVSTSTVEKTSNEDICIAGEKLSAIYRRITFGKILETVGKRRAVSVTTKSKGNRAVVLLTFLCA